MRSRVERLALAQIAGGYVDKETGEPVTLGERLRGFAEWLNSEQGDDPQVRQLERELGVA